MDVYLGLKTKCTPLSLSGTVERLELQGNIRQKITSFAPSSLVSFLSLCHLDLSRNNISSLDGLQFCKSLESLNVYYNNISSISELERLSKNSLLQEIDIRLNPVSVMSTEYRYEHIPQSPKTTTPAAPPSPMLVPRPPLAMLQPKQDAYDAYTTHGAFTPNPRQSCSTPGTPTRDSVLEENRELREKYEEYKEKYNIAVSDRIAKESYVRLQEDYYKSLKKGEKLSEKCENSEAQIQQLKDQIASLTTESSTLKQELLVRKQVAETEKELKVICRELQETIQSDRERHSEELKSSREQCQDMAREFTDAIKTIREAHKEEIERIRMVHQSELKESDGNFVKLQKLVDISNIIGELK
eukprot:sb/3466085/